MVLHICRFCQQNKRISGINLMLMAFIILIPFRTLAEGDPIIKNQVKVVVLDAGHGGKDPGAIGKYHKEKDIVLAVSLKVGQYIQEHFEDVKVIYTRTGDTFIPLNERPAIANKNKADVFISIHANASPRALSYGTETFVMGLHKNSSNFEVAKLENSVITLEEDYTTKYEGFNPDSPESYIIFSLLQHTYIEQSLVLASLIQQQFRERVSRFDRGVKQAGFLVLWQTTMPSVLVELGFISHPDEEKFMASPQGQEYLASAIFRAFRDYKTEIESSSNFQTDNNYKENKSINNVNSDNFYFKIQVLSSQKRIPFDDKFFKGHSSIEEFADGKRYKYAIERFENYEDASVYCNAIQSRFKGAFIVAVKEGSIVPLNQVIRTPK